MKLNPFARASGKRVAEKSAEGSKSAVQEPGAHRKPRFTMLALEPRFMFDGAAVATAADAAQASAPASDASDAGGSDDGSHPVITERGEGSPASERSEVVFVDTRVPDYQSIVEAISPDAEVVLIDTGRDGVEQISEALNGRADIDAIHIISHGDAGVLLLGNGALNSGNLDSYSDALAGIGSALSADGDILLYGCDVAKGDEGAAFIASLAEVTGADVAASDDATGAASMGGDWELEADEGSIETAGLSLGQYNYLLANGTLTFTEGTGLGDGVATDGEGGSVALAGIDIEIRNISDVNGTPTGQLQWRDNSFMASADASYSGLTFDDGANGIAKGMSIKSSDGSEFQINGFTYYDWGATESTTITVKGYRDGVEVASMNFEGWSGADGTYEPQNVSLDSTFDNVDDVRLYISAGGWEPGQAGTNHSINNIIIADAFVPNGVAGTIDFGDGIPDVTDLGPVVTDGMGGSNDIPDIVYQIYSTDTAGNPTGAHWHYYVDLNVGIGGIVGDESTGDPVIVIDSADGSEFWFKGITTNNYVGAQSEVTFEGFRDGVSTGSVTLSMDYLVTGVNTYTTADLPPSIFENVDEVRITNPNDVDGLPPGTKTNVIGLDAIVVDNPVATSAPTLTEGDIVVGGMNAMTDTITLVTTADISAGTVIYITDKGWDQATDAFTTGSTGDGVITWTVSSTISAGTVLSLHLAGSDGATTLTNVTAGSDLSGDIVVSNYTVSDPLNPAGDQVFIYQGSASNPFFISGFNNSAGPVDSTNWNTSIGAGLRDSMLPDGSGSQNSLVNGTSALGVSGGGAQQDNVFYNGPTSATDRATWLSRLLNVANWSGDATGAGDPSFEVSTGSDIEFAPPNPDPVIDANGASGGATNTTNFIEGGASIRIVTSDATLTDDDTITGMTLVLGAAPNGADEIINYSAALNGGASLASLGLTGSYDSGTGTYTISGIASAAVYQNVMRAMQYYNGSDAPDTTARTITITATDSEGGSGQTTSTVNITAVNDAPTATNLTQSKNATEGGSAVALDDIVVTDVDAGDTVTATLTMSNAAAGSLSTGTYGSATSTFNAGTGVWTVTGSVADVNAALAAVALTPSADNEQNFTITTRIRDAADTGPADGTITVTVTGVNDAPTATNLTQTKSATEGGSAVALDDIVVTDVDSGDTVTATLTLSNAAAGALSTGTFGSATSTFNLGTGIWTVTGSVADVNAALAAVAFTPSSNNDQNFTITTRIRDAADTGPADGTITVTVTGVNDAPTASNLTQSKAATEGGSAVALDDIVVTDVDTGDTVTATLTLSDAAAGTLSTGTYGSATSTFNAGTGVWTVTGSVADVNAALAAVALTPSADNDQDFTITTRIRDASDTGPADGTITVTVTPTNDAPVATTSGGSSTYTEDGAPVVVDGGLTLSDVDNSTLASATVSITGGFQAGEDVLAFTNDGSTMGNITASYNSATGVLTLTSAGSTATIAQWQAALRSVTYGNTSNDPDTTGRTISFSVSDGSDASNTATKTVSVTAVNDSPSIAVNTGASIETGGLTTITDAMLNEGDPDDAGTGITYTITTAPTGGTLFIDANGNGFVDGGEELSLSSTFTQDDIDQGRIKYQHGGGVGTGDSFTFSVADGGEDGAAALTGQQFSITVAERPVVSVGGGSPSHTENGVSTVIAPGLTIADSDSPTMSGATVTVTDFVAGDLLNFTNQYGITGSYNAGTGVLTLTGTATRAQYEAALRSITYSTTSDNPATGAGNADRVIEFRVSDGGLQSTAGTTQTVAISNSNDAPVLDASASPALNGIDEDSAAPINGSTAGSTLVSALLGGMSDVDTGALQGLAITGISTEGMLWYSIDGGATWSQAPAVSEANALLLRGDARLYFQPAADLSGTVADAITFRAWDRTSGSSGGTADTTANGGGTAFSTATDTASIAIANVNDPPELNAGTGSSSFSGGAGSPKTPVAVAPELTITDPDPGETMASADVQIVGNYVSGEDVLAFTPDASKGNITASFDPGTGTLTLTSAGGTATPAQWQTALRSVTYANTSDTPNTSNRVISFTLNDGDADSNTVDRVLSIEVVNDPPAISAPGTITVTEDVASPVTGIIFSDPDAGSGFVTVTLSVPQGALSAISAMGVTVGGTSSDLTLTGTIANINSFIALSSISYTTAQDRTTDVTLSIEINDGGNTGSGGAQSAHDTATISVTGVNDGPAANGQIPDASWRGPGSFTIPESAFIDPDAGDTLTYSLALDGGGPLPSWLHFDPITRELSGSPPSGSGSLSIVVTATDSHGLSATSGFTLDYTNASVVVPRQQPPMPEPVEFIEFTENSIGPAPLFTTPQNTLFVPGTWAGGEDWLQLSVQETNLQPGGNVSASTDAVELWVQPGRLTYTLPADLFQHSDPDAHLALDARLPDGRPLPSWLSFDSETWSFSGQPPAGVAEVIVEVTARDPNGHEAKVRIEIMIGNGERQHPGATPPPDDPQRRGDLHFDMHDRASAESAAAPDRQHVAVMPVEIGDAASGASAIDQAGAISPAGKPSFSAQLAMARGAEANLAALQETNQKAAKPS